MNFSFSTRVGITGRMVPLKSRARCRMRRRLNVHQGVRHLSGWPTLVLRTRSTIGVDCGSSCLAFAMAWLWVARQRWLARSPAAGQHSRPAGGARHTTPYRSFRSSPLLLATPNLKGTTSCTTDFDGMLVVGLLRPVRARRPRHRTQIPGRCRYPCKSGTVR